MGLGFEFCFPGPGVLDQCFHSALWYFKTLGGGICLGRFMLMFNKGDTVMVTDAWHAMRAFYEGGVGSEEKS